VLQSLEVFHLGFSHTICSVISILTLFTVIAAYRPVNKNVNTGAVIRAKPCTDRAVRSQTTGELSDRWLQLQAHERLERKIGSHCSVSERTQIHSVKSKDRVSRAAARLACSAKVYSVADE